MRKKPAMRQTLEKSDEPQSSEVLNLRVACDDADWFRNAARNRGEKLNQFFVHLLELERTNSDSRSDESSTHGLTKEESILKKLGGLLSLTSFANHAFSLGFWARAIESYSSIEARAARIKVDDVAQFARYRLGFCWHEIANDLRREVLMSPATGAELLGRLENVLNAGANAIACNKTFLQREYHPILQYNLACTLSRQAMFAVELELCRNDETKWRPLILVDEDRLRRLWGDRFCDQVHKSARVTKKSLKPSRRPKHEETLGNSWSREVGRKTREIVVSIANQAMLALNGLKDVSVGASFMTQRSRNDPDLLMLRSDPDFASEFDRWLNQWTGTGMEALFERLQESRGYQLEKSAAKWRQEFLPQIPQS